jgi:hypothetical protein
MSWTKDSHLTDDQIEFLKIGGGNIKVTSLKTGVTHRYSIRPANVGKGMIVRLIDGNETQYVGWIPFNQNGVASNSFINTSASKFGIHHPVFKTFLWVWTNKQTDTFASKCLLTNA